LDRGQSANGNAYGNLHGHVHTNPDEHQYTDAGSD
jgi:hypothetical protein